MVEALGEEEMLGIAEERNHPAALITISGSTYQYILVDGTSEVQLLKSRQSSGITHPDGFWEIIIRNPSKSL